MLLAIARHVAVRRGDTPLGACDSDARSHRRAASLACRFSLRHDSLARLVSRSNLYTPRRHRKVPLSPPDTALPTECPSDNDVAEFALGGLDDAGRARLEEHLGTCAMCRRLVAELASSEMGDADERENAGATAISPLARDDDDDPPNAPRVLQRGDRFGRYVVLSWLGEGGMGAVYRARDTVLFREVALKVVRPEAMGALGAEHALREARSAAALEHPNVVAAFDVGQVGGVTFLAMELVLGRSLRALIREQATPLETKLSWLAAIASSLAAAHARGLAHRDIKPENVMVRDDGIVKVLDFGLARWFDDRPKNAGDPATIQGARIGTLAYMAPELLRGEKADAKSDQFAWGVVAYELLSGRHPSLPSDAATPFDAAQLAKALDTRAPEPLRTHVPDLAPSVEATVMRALSKRADDRFDTMTDARAALIAAMSAHATARTGATSAIDASPRARRRFVIGAIAAIAAACAIAVVVAFITHRRPPAAIAPAPSSASASHASGEIANGGTANAEALGAYRAGMQATRDAAFDAAYRGFARAVELDAEFAAAHLRYAITSSMTNEPIREHFRQATRLRFALSEHDRVVLDAFEPWMRVPRDPLASEKRLAAAATSHSSDADYLHLLCRMRFFLADYPGSIKACEATLAADPEFAGAMWIEGLDQVFMGDEARAMKTLADCIRVSPTATSCLNDRFVLDGGAGRCDDALADSRKLIGIDPENWRHYKYLANALAGTGAARESVVAAMGQWFERRDPKFRAEDQAHAEAALAINEGDFVTARTKVADWEKAIAGVAEEWVHADEMRLQTQLALEMERSSEASAIAAQFIAQRSAWTPTAIFYDDSRIGAWSVQARTGAISPSAFRLLRSTWLETEAVRAEASPFATNSTGVRWTAAYADSTVTVADAREALVALPRFLPLPNPHIRKPFFDEPIGRVFLLAGQIDDALPFLERGAHACFALEYPIDIRWARLELGEALESKGERAEACDAYRPLVIERGSIVSRSAKRAIARARALGCAMR